MKLVESLYREAPRYEGCFCLSTKNKCPDCPGVREALGACRAPNHQSGFFFLEDVMSKELVVGAAQEAEFVYTISKIKALGDLLTALPHKETPYLQPPTLCTLGHIIVDQAERMEELAELGSD